MILKENILIIEDEKNICSFIERILEPQGYRVASASTGKEGIQFLATGRFDLILLDLGLPDMDGLDLIEQVRSWSSTPIIVISARTLERSKVAALDLGADDYLTKPFGTAELVARIRTALRHSQNHCSRQVSRYEAGDLVIDFERRLVKVKGQEVHLTQIEYKLVSLLAQNAGRVMTYESIISKIWGPFADNDNQILRVNMAHIRRKLEENPAEPKYIFTEIGVGYRMRED
ncbi:MAG: response regulator transcription factor [Clostridiales bacterium]|nr:response regulator transcription factor [Clostridiales bacterium]